MPPEPAPIEFDRGLDPRLLRHVEDDVGIALGELFLLLELIAQLHSGPKELSVLDEGLEPILQILRRIGVNSGRLEFRVPLEESSHEIALVSEASRLDTVGKEEKPWGLDPAARHDVRPRSGVAALSLQRADFGFHNNRCLGIRL
jgi:hypothetical protein